jgi:hypothetical protein
MDIWEIAKRAQEIQKMIRHAAAMEKEEEEKKAAERAAFSLYHVDVYRLQNEIGIGPFYERLINPESVFYDPERMQVWAEKHTGAYNPEGYCIGWGCRTLENIKEVFNFGDNDVYRRELFEQGFHLVQLKVFHVVLDLKHEVMFTRRKPLHEDVTIMPWPE